MYPASYVYWYPFLNLRDPLCTSTYHDYNASRALLTPFLTLRLDENIVASDSKIFSEVNIDKCRLAVVQVSLRLHPSSH